MHRCPEPESDPLRFRRRAFRVALRALLTLGLLTGCHPPASPETLREKLAELDRPNLVLIVADTLRADWTSPYGFEAKISPELGRWAEEGVVFEQALAQSSWTKVSMASLLTSLWPHSHGIRLANDGLDERAVTLPGVLRQAGYRTYGVQSNGWLEQSFGFHNGFDRYVFPRALSEVGKLSRSTVWPHGERVLEETIRLLEAHDPAEPFFLYLHFMDVHEYSAPPEFKRFGDTKRGSYLAAIRWLDDVLERTRRQVYQAGYGDDTIWIFAADHGEAFGENQSHGHARNVHTPVLQVPLLIRFPFPVEALRVPSQVRNLDIAPTVLELAGVPIPESFQGQSLLPLLESPGDHPDRESFAGLGAPILAGVVEQVSINDGTWSMARNLDDEGKEFLFDRRVDRREDANLVDLEPEQAQALRKRLDAHLSGETQAGIRATDVRIDPGIAERLRAVGYLQ